LDWEQINRNAVAPSSPTLPLRLRWEHDDQMILNRNAVAPLPLPSMLGIAAVATPLGLIIASAVPRVAAAATLG